LRAVRRGGKASWLLRTPSQSKNGLGGEENSKKLLPVMAPLGNKGIFQKRHTIISIQGSVPKVSYSIMKKRGGKYMNGNMAG